jgi:hypothetical protein
VPKRVPKQQIGTFQDVHLWGLAEVSDPSVQARFEQAADESKGAGLAGVLGALGGGMRLLALNDTTRFDLVKSYELNDLNTIGNARAPLVLHLCDKGSRQEFLYG